MSQILRSKAQKQHPSGIIQRFASLRSVELSKLSTGAPENTDTIPGGSILRGGYFVIGSAGVPNVNFTPIAGEIWTDAGPRILELRNNSAAMVT